ncbi:putative Copper transporting ATPase [Taylorella asinigenitalis 14/45]|uniref:Putative Copper transporting ATPase n=1 Tax=Taylorella asinigenitalis 14/45 TaxID=1091495 RepID=I7J0X4_9BURK|nr:putative Copper transporting ATPase [Taylorella asinigenitalis]CCG19206.1 putative Copper transporting ATPase [Taylorella asinigenitalis 14/45]
MASNKSIFSIPDNLPQEERSKRRALLSRLGISWLVMMQIMMFAVPGYVKPSYENTDSYEILMKVIVMMNWISLALTIPIILYCATPIWNGLLRDENRNHINMNWPVAIGIIVAFVPSMLVTITHRGEVYYDSISMFVAFLLTARYLELAAEQSTFNKASTLDLRTLHQSLKNRADRLAYVFVILQIVLAVVTSAVWYFWIDKAHALPVLVSLFVMSCPCAMAMSVPTAFSAARAGLSEEYVTRYTQNLYSKIKICTYQNLYGSLIWHLLMTPLAMIGIVEPWLAAITMLISSLGVAWNSYRLFKYLKSHS